MSCADQSSAVSEPLWGTAAHAQRIIALEFTGRWGPNIEETSLPQSARSWLARVAPNENTRVQLIRRPQHTTTALAIFAADLTKGVCQRHVASDYDALDSLDEPFAPGAGVEWREPVFLVCSHGKRDACCAKHGVALFKQIETVAPGIAWQTTHVGGHRFAPTLIALPLGVSYGRITASEVPALVDGLRASSLPLPEKLRGRCTLPPAAQAAEAWLRRQNKLNAKTTSISAAIDSESDNRFRINITANGQRFVVEVEKQISDAVRKKSCELTPTPFESWVTKEI